MRYYVTADIHSYFTPFEKALEEKGYFSDGGPKKLVICGDLFDRGKEPLKLQAFLMDLIERDEVILIRGNHEDLLEAMIDTWDEMSYLEKENISNGTAETVLRLTRSTLSDLLTDPKAILKKFLETPAMNVILPSMKDYHETEHYIFTHGWIPARQYFTELGDEIYLMDPDWRNAGKEDWMMARWTNGMLAHHSGVWESGKTIFCGHWHTSFAHSRYEGKGPEFGPGEVFSPYCAEGITALDACTAHTGKVNVVIAEED